MIFSFGCFDKIYLNVFGILKAVDSPLYAIIELRLLLCQRNV
jgi:hypothetical protein